MRKFIFLFIGFCLLLFRTDAKPTLASDKVYLIETGYLDFSETFVFHIQNPVEVPKPIERQCYLNKYFYIHTNSKITTISNLLADFKIGWQNDLSYRKGLQINSKEFRSRSNQS